MKRFSIALIACLFALTALAAGAPLPADSILQSSDTYTTQSGKDFQLADRRGHVQLISMFYSSCPYTCPLTIDSGLAIQRSLTPAERDRLQVMFVSFDPERDTPAVLNALATKRKLDLNHWTLARADADGARKLAALLGVRYRKLADGEFNHTSGLILLDTEGRILAKSDKLGTVPDPAFITAVKKALDMPPVGG